MFKNLFNILFKYDPGNLTVSSYPENPPLPFAPPAVGFNLQERLSKDEAILQQWHAQDGISPDSEHEGMRYSVYPSQGELLSPETRNVWFLERQPFRGVLILQPYFPKTVGFQEDFTLKALLDGREIKLKIENSELLNSLTFKLKNFEQIQVNIETEPLPEGAHTLYFLLFKYPNNEATDLATRSKLGKLSFAYQLYQVNVKTTEPVWKPKFQEWGSGTALPSMPNAYVLSDDNPKLTDSLQLWDPPAYQTSTEIHYKALINNATSIDREYCLMAFLNWEQIPVIRNDMLVCGRVQAGKLAEVSGSFITPTQPGYYPFQLLRFENPSMKESYLKADPDLFVALITVSHRVLLHIT